MDSNLFFIFSILIILGKFADFVIHSQPESAVLVIPENTSKTTKLSLHDRALISTNFFFTQIFKGRYISGYGYFHCFLISAFFVQGTLLFSTIFDLDTWEKTGVEHYPVLWIVVGLGALILSNFVFDVFSVILTRFFISCFLKNSSGEYIHQDRKYHAIRQSMILLAPLFVVLVMSIFVLTMNLSFSIIMTVRGIATDYFTLDNIGTWYVMQENIVLNESRWRFFNPVEEGRFIGLAGLNLMLLCATPVIAPMLAITGFLIAYIVDLGDKLTNNSCSRLLNRFVTHGQPVFLQIASVLVLLGAAAATIVSVMK